MKRHYRLLFGPIAAVLLGFGVMILAEMIPGYSHVRQTVSEIGEASSPARLPFAVLLCAVAGCILVFASALRDVSLEAGRWPLAAYFTAAIAVSAAGVGVFAFPHPLHNVFGESELIGYQAPLVLALTWRGSPEAKRAVSFSWIMFGLIWCAIAMNLVALDRRGAIWAYTKPVYGLIQRVLFAAWFGWCAGVGVLMFRRNSERVQEIHRS